MGEASADNPQLSEAEEAGKVVYENVYTNASDDVIREIAEFYNQHFPLSQHTEEGKTKRYRTSSLLPFNIIARSEGNLVGLLESRISLQEGKDVRLLDTLLVVPDYRGQNLARNMFDKLLQGTDPQQNIVLHFRDSKREELGEFYSKLGFEAPRIVGSYRNGEPKWEMRFNREK